MSQPSTGRLGVPKYEQVGWRGPSTGRLGRGPEYGVSVATPLLQNRPLMISPHSQFDLNSAFNTFQAQHKITILYILVYISITKDLISEMVPTA